ncbi:hypothetical protein MPL3356_10045 [Mesorhizobium plurifarium]|uniref:Uncharacterized protein n=1 Tax=Mesorhizobium plurifarium TaxID=69974 RepID=A0A090D9A4_MESPL|nr:hypothetical protein MPL3356_10045 [Mesorhizobium plurifarium]
MRSAASRLPFAELLIRPFLNILPLSVSAPYRSAGEKGGVQAPFLIDRAYVRYTLAALGRRDYAWICIVSGISRLDAQLFDARIRRGGIPAEVAF